MLKERLGPETIYRGCFVLDIKRDVCHVAENGLEYCWCSTKDLCNMSTMTRPHTLVWAMGFILIKWS